MAEPVLLARCPSGNLSARREQFHLGERYRAGSAQPEPTSPRGEIVLSLRDCAGTSGALCAQLQSHPIHCSQSTALLWPHGPRGPCWLRRPRPLRASPRRDRRRRDRRSSGPRCGPAAGVRRLAARCADRAGCAVRALSAPLRAGTAEGGTAEAAVPDAVQQRVYAGCAPCGPCWLTQLGGRGKAEACVRTAAANAFRRAVPPFGGAPCRRAAMQTCGREAVRP